MKTVLFFIHDSSSYFIPPFRCTSRFYSSLFFSIISRSKQSSYVLIHRVSMQAFHLDLLVLQSSV